MSEMNLNWANKIYIFLGCCILGASVFNVLNYQNWDRYYYDATAIAPEFYPVSVRECDFTTGDENDDAIIGSEEVNRFNTKWTGTGDFLQLREKRLLPEKLNIAYFSYRDKKFYKGSFNLPTKRIEQIFKRAIRERKTERLSSYRDQLRGLSFIVGIANNGNILVWMRGIYLDELILKVQAKPAKPRPIDLYYPKPPIKALDYEEEFKNVHDSLKVLMKKGYDAKANYADSATQFIQNNTELWEYQRKEGIIDYGK